MADNTPFNKIKWYTCPVCTETYDSDYWENRSTCVCCGAPFSQGAKNTEQQVQADDLCRAAGIETRVEVKDVRD